MPQLISKPSGRWKLLSALFLCVAAYCPPVAASESTLAGNASQTTREALLPQNALQATREHWLRSRMQFSGRTNRDAEHRDGDLNLGLKGLFWANHRADVKYSDARTYRVGNERRVLGSVMGCRWRAIIWMWSSGTRPMRRCPGQMVLASRRKAAPET